jgi:hypothetical protein
MRRATPAVGQTQCQIPETTSIPRTPAVLSRQRNQGSCNACDQPCGGHRCSAPKKHRQGETIRFVIVSIRRSRRCLTSRRSAFIATLLCGSRRKSRWRSARPPGSRYRHLRTRTSGSDGLSFRYRILLVTTFANPSKAHQNAWHSSWRTAWCSALACDPDTPPETAYRARD